MESTWSHPVWGSFAYDSVAWTNGVIVPAFDRFSYKPDFADEAPPTSRYELSFEVDDADALPSIEAVELAEGLIANQLELVGTIAKALWDDFQGEGPDSGMWWHGEPEEVMEDLDPEWSLDDPDDILFLLQVSSIVIHPEVYGYDGPLAEICFNAAFEEEHGVGVLTDGANILGLGYAVSVTPFGE